MKLKLNALKAAFPLCQPIWALPLTLSIFPPRFCLPSLSPSFFVARFSHRVRELYQISWAHSDFNTFMNCKNAQVWLDGCKGPPPRHTPLPPTNQLINIAMETKWQGIAFDFTEAGLLLPVVVWRMLFVNAHCREQSLKRRRTNSRIKGHNQVLKIDREEAML